MHAFLYIGQPTEKRTQTITAAVDTLRIPSYDRLILCATEKASIGISEVRKFIRQLQFAPHTAEGIAGIIPEADILTTEAQQALLKTIEEPPPHVKLFFGAPSETSVLSTIASRCQIYSIHPDIQTETTDLPQYADALEKLCNSTYGKRITYIQSIGKTKEDAKIWIDHAIQACHNLVAPVSDKPKTTIEQAKLITLLHALLDVKRLMANNINPYQLLEHVFLTL